MNSGKFITLIGFMALLGVLAFALYYVFEVSFDRNHMFPEHSSMRADPRGVMMLFETLEQIEGVDAHRSFVPFSKWLAKMPGRPLDTTCILLDARRHDLQDPALLAFLQSGGRLIISPGSLNFNAPVRSDRDASPEEPSNDDGNDKSHPAAVAPKINPLAQYMVPIGLRQNATASTESAHALPHSTLAAGAPEQIPWRAKSYLSIKPENNSSPDWHTLYAVDENPVIIGRQVGKGQIIVLADGLPLTNESLYTDDDHNFFKWLLGDRTHIIFDEYHFGIVQPRGIAMLARQYNLELTALTLLLSFALLIWHGASPLLPAVTAEDGDSKRSQTALSGYRDLLQRYMKSDNQLLVCLDEWQSTFMTRKSDQQRHAKNFAEARNTALQETKKPRKHRDFQSAYQTITAILNRRR